MPDQIINNVKQSQMTVRICKHNVIKLLYLFKNLEKDQTEMREREKKPGQRGGMGGLLTWLRVMLSYLEKRSLSPKEGKSLEVKYAGIVVTALLNSRRIVLKIIRMSVKKSQFIIQNDIFCLFKLF